MRELSNPAIPCAPHLAVVPPPDSLDAMPPTRADADHELEALLTQHGAWLERTVRALCPQHRGIDHDEVLQDVRLRVWRSLKRGRAVEKPASYLYRAATTATIDAVRRVTARREDQLEGADTAASETAPKAWPDPKPGPERVALSSEVQEQIARALERLSENRRLAVKLHLQGFTSTEIGRLCDWTEAKSRNLASRGMKDLRRELSRSLSS